MLLLPGLKRPLLFGQKEEVIGLKKDKKTLNIR